MISLQRKSQVQKKRSGSHPETHQLNLDQPRAISVYHLIKDGYLKAANPILPAACCILLND